ncbi:MAG: hypothetical protein JXA60_06625 [Candidatus Coatesbacteria bacterium]|nr:hypothetical protein [Candidatus Coatesbacteria bacterium]
MSEYLRYLPSTDSVINEYRKKYPDNSFLDRELAQIARIKTDILRRRILEENDLRIESKDEVISLIINKIKDDDTEIPQSEKIYDGSGLLNRNFFHPAENIEIPYNIHERCKILLESIFQDSKVILTNTPYEVFKKIVYPIWGIQVPVKRMDRELINLLMETGIRFHECGTANHFKKEDLGDFPLLVYFSWLFKAEGFLKEPEQEEILRHPVIFFTPFLPMLNPESINGLFSLNFVTSCDISVFSLFGTRNICITLINKNCRFETGNPDLAKPDNSALYSLYNSISMSERKIDIINPEAPQEDFIILAEKLGCRWERGETFIMKNSPYRFSDYILREKALSLRTARFGLSETWYNILEGNKNS